jgi:hypothetical protein
MWSSSLAFWIFAYLVPGIFLTAVVLAAFPPVPGYSPPWTTRLMAWVTLVSLWPVVAMLGLCLAIGRLYRWYSGQETPKCRVERRLDIPGRQAHGPLSRLTTVSRRLL